MPTARHRPASRSWRTVASAALLAVAALAGCSGGSSSTAPEDEARSALRTFLASCASDEPLAASLNLTEAARVRLLRAPTVLEGCRKTVALEGLADLPEVLQRRFLGGASIASLSVEGGFAKATVRTRAGATGSAELESSRGLWLISGPLPRP